MSLAKLMDQIKALLGVPKATHGVVRLRHTEQGPLRELQAAVGGEVRRGGLFDDGYAWVWTYECSSEEQRIALERELSKTLGELGQQ